MKATIKAGALATALGIHNGDPRGTIPILKTARVDVSSATIQITDMERLATARVTMVGDGVFLLPIEPARGFASRIDANADIEIAVAGTTVKLSCGRARATMESLDPAYFPIMQTGDKGETFTIDGAAFVSMLARVEAFVSNDETRYYLCGVYLEARDGKLTVTATQGSVLSTYAAPIDFRGDCKAIIPTSTLAVIKKIARGPMTITVAHNMIEFAGPSSSVMSKVIDGTYPEYERVMAKNGDRVEFKASDMRDAIALIAAASDDGRGATKLTIDDNSIEVAGADGTSRATTTIDCASDGMKVEVGVNYKYIMDAIKPIPGAVVMTISDPSGAFGLSDPDDPRLRITIMSLRV